MHERLDAMKHIWSSEVAEYAGEHVRFGPLMAWPKPVQKPYPPVFIGGGRTKIPRVVALADGWCPGTASLDESDLVAQLDALQQAAEEAGRDPIPVMAFHVTPVDELAAGSANELTDHRWDVLQRAGVERVVVVLPPWRGQNLRMVERYGRLIERMNA